LASAYHPANRNDLFNVAETKLGRPRIFDRFPEAIDTARRSLQNDNFGMKINTLHDALVHELRDLYSAEVQLTKALPKMAKASSHEQLTEAIEEHLEQTKGHVERLEKALKRLEASTRGEKCKAMEGLIEEGKSTLELDADDMVRDALIISIAQKVEHYEIAGYGTARTFAQRLGEKEVASLLEDTLEEESETDRKLTKLAESTVNRDAEVAANK
jgi:ferritin-like metal-binding protein YciE